MAARKINQREEFAKVCPKCGSDDSVLTAAFIHDAGSSVLKCKKCGYEGGFVEINKKDLPKFINRAKKQGDR